MKTRSLVSAFALSSFIAVACSSSPKTDATSGASSSSGSGGASSSGSAVSSSSSTSTSSSGASSSGAGGDGGADAGPGNACTVVSKGTAGFVLRGTLLLASGPVSGELFVSGTTIACAAASCASTAGYASASVFDCPGSVISPGLINSHDHTSYATAPPVAHGTTRWDHRNGWRTGAGGEPELMTAASTTNVTTLAAAELRHVLSGTTSIIGSGGVSGLARNLAAYSAPTEVEGLTGPTVYFDTFPLGDENGTELTSGCAYPSPTSAASAFEGGEAYAPHVAEGINSAAENEFTCISGSLGLLTSSTAVIHGVGLNARDLNAIAAAQAKIIWSPRSNVSLYGNTTDITVVKNLGITTAMGTDWLPTGSMNMLRELACVDYLNQSYFGAALTDQEIWTMATTNGAIAAKFDNQIGALAAGMVADVAVFSGATQDYRAVIEAGVEDVRLVLRGGTPLYGDANLVGALSSSCAATEVCGISKQVCIDTPSVTFAQIEADAASIYPLYFCKGTIPTGEPTCVPYRSTYTSGETTSDPDGDGLTGAADDCPSIFNPIRPMDGTTQADVDGDGVGDACDADPLDPTKH